MHSQQNLLTQHIHKTKKQQPQKTLSKAVSQKIFKTTLKDSPLFSPNHKEINTDLTYFRHKLNSPKTQSNILINKQSVRPRKRQRQNFNKKLKEKGRFQEQKKLTLQNLQKLSSIVKKSSQQTWAKDKQHFLNFDSTIDNNYETQINYLSPSRYKKVKQDFCDQLQFSSKSLHNPQQNTSKGKKHNYRLDMFKQSYILGLQNQMRQSMRKPCYTRTSSKVQFG